MPSLRFPSFSESGTMVLGMESVCAAYAIVLPAASASLPGLRFCASCMFDSSRRRSDSMVNLSQKHHWSCTYLAVFVVRLGCLSRVLMIQTCGALLSHRPNCFGCRLTEQHSQALLHYLPFLIWCLASEIGPPLPIPVNTKEWNHLRRICYGVACCVCFAAGSALLCQLHD